MQTSAGTPTRLNLIYCDDLSTLPLGKKEKQAEADNILPYFFENTKEEMSTVLTG